MVGIVTFSSEPELSYSILLTRGDAVPHCSFCSDARDCCSVISPWGAAFVGMEAPQPILQGRADGLQIVLWFRLRAEEWSRTRHRGAHFRSARDSMWAYEMILSLVVRACILRSRPDLLVANDDILHLECEEKKHHHLSVTNHASRWSRTLYLVATNRLPKLFFMSFPSPCCTSPRTIVGLSAATCLSLKIDGENGHHLQTSRHSWLLLGLRCFDFGRRGKIARHKFQNLIKQDHRKWQCKNGLPFGPRQVLEPENALPTKKVKRKTSEWGK